VDPGRDRGQPITQAVDQQLRPDAGPGAVPHGKDGIEHLLEPARVEGDDIGAAAEVVQGFLDVAGGQRADSAQILREDDVRSQGGQRVRVQGAGCRVQRCSPAASFART
jgi:hypothetical protein